MNNRHRVYPRLPAFTCDAVRTSGRGTWITGLDPVQGISCLSGHHAPRPSSIVLPVKRENAPRQAGENSTNAASYSRLVLIIYIRYLIVFCFRLLLRGSDDDFFTVIFITFSFETTFYDSGLEFNYAWKRVRYRSKNEFHPDGNYLISRPNNFTANNVTFHFVARGSQRPSKQQYETITLGDTDCHRKIPVMDSARSVLILFFGQLSRDIFTIDILRA